MATTILHQPLTVGTAHAAKLVAVALLASNPVTATSFLEGSQANASRPAVRVVNRTSILPLGEAEALYGSFVWVPPSTEPERATTAIEEVIGQLRSWSLFTANWDGEQALAPVPQSLRDATAFVSIWPPDKEPPAPMLLSSGHAGLFLESDTLYADLEFLGDGRVTYYIEHPGVGKHKGVVKFDREAMPAVFSALIVPQLA